MSDQLVQVVDDTIVLPQAPVGFDQVITWGYDGLLNVQPANVFETHGMDFYSPVSLSIDTIQWTMEQVRQTFAQYGQEVLAYGVSRRTALDISVPTRLCIGDQCIDVPSQFCIPLTNICVGGGGTNLVTAYEYWVWIVTRDMTAGAALASPFIPVLGILAIGLVIVVLGVMVSWWKGSISFDQFKQFFGSITPGGQLKEVESGATLMFAIVGAGMVATAMLVPRLAPSAELGLTKGPVTGKVGLSTQAEAPRRR